MKRKELVEIIKEVGVSSSDLQHVIEQKVTDHLSELGGGDGDVDNVKDKVKKFLSKFRQKYNKYYRNLPRMLEMEYEWLEGDVIKEAEIRDNTNVEAGPGRPEKPWDEASDRSKRRKVQLLKENNNTLALATAAIGRSKNSPGQNALGAVIMESVKDAQKVRDSLDAVDKLPVMMSAEDALALKMQCDLSDGQYQLLRNASKKQNADIFPTLHSILTAKSACYPDMTEITETSAKCSLQSMVDHTLSRILVLSSDVLDEEEVEKDPSGVLYMKAGMDGASSQSVYNQKFDETDLEAGKYHEESLFQTAIVPLKLEISGVEVWVNQKPSSSHFCRPLQLQYQKETKEVIRDEEARVNKEIESLKDFQLNITLSSGKKVDVSVKYSINVTMLDGKAVNALTDTNSSQSCNVCGAKPKEMNNLKVIREKPASARSLKLGLSSLHCWIRSFEYILHLGYKMENKTFLAKSVEEKESVVRRKAEIQRKFREQLSLVVDTPKQGFGNTNCGNTGRRAFEESKAFADITGVDEEVIVRIRNILKAVCSGYEIDISSFKDYCLATSERIIQLYGWYTMPPTLHKLLEHGYQVAEILDLPVGMYSEEAQEAQNKEIRNARLSHTCKISRKNAMKNQFQYLLIRSDPVVSSTAFKKSKSFAGQPLDDEVLAMLLKV